MGPERASKRKEPDYAAQQPYCLQASAPSTMNTFYAMILPCKMHNLFLMLKNETKQKKTKHTELRRVTDSEPGSPLFIPSLWVSEVFSLFCTMASTLGRSSMKFSQKRTTPIPI